MQGNVGKRDKWGVCANSPHIKGEKRLDGRDINKPP